MKNYKYFFKESSAKTVVFAFGRFQPPTNGHELLVNSIIKTAKSHNADSVIYASKTQDKKKNPLSVDQKIHYLKLMFPRANFKAANDKERTPIEAAKELNKKYKNLIMVAGSDRVDSFTKLLNDYNGKEYHYDSIVVVSSGERDPDSDTAAGMSGTKMRAAAIDGNYAEFKKGLPSSLKDVDGKKLMSDIRIGLGKEAMSEELYTREQYYRGDIFNVGDIVESEEIEYTIISRGTNYLFLEDKLGNKTKKWLQDVTATISEETMINEATYSSSDKLKIARIISGALGVESTSSSPEELVNLALRKIKNKPMHSEYIATVQSMLSTAEQAGIKYDSKLVSDKLTEATKKAKEDEERLINPKPIVGEIDPEGKEEELLRRQKINYKIHEEEEDDDEDDEVDHSDEELDGMIAHINDLEDILHAYDDDELHIVDDEGSHVDHITEDTLHEVLSRQERIKAKVRFARSASKRQRKMKVALHTRSTPAKINSRARVMAVRLMKQKLSKKPLNKLSIQEKERIERIIKNKSKAINKMSMKLVGRIRKIENTRLHPVRK